MGNGKKKRGPAPKIDIRPGPPPPQSYFDSFAKKPIPPEQVVIPQEKVISAREALDKFRSFAENWDAELESLFAMPDSIYFYVSSQTMFFSAESHKSVIDTVRGMRFGRLVKPEAEYGIIVEEGASTIYLTLVDARRRIAVRGTLLCFEKTPPEGDWAKFKVSLKNALATAQGKDARARGLFAVSDCSVDARLLAPETFASIWQQPFQSSPTKKS